MEPIEILRNFTGIQLSDESATELRAIMEHKRYDKNEQILNGGMVCRGFYIVEKGTLRLFYYKKGHDVTEHITCDGDISCCIESMFKQKPTELCIEAIEPTTVWYLDYAGFMELAHRYHDINETYIEILKSWLIESQYRADSWRFDTARERYERFCKEYPLPLRRASVNDIANYLLMSPETLSRIRAGKG